MKASCRMPGQPEDTIAIIECPWCGGFERHFVHVEAPGLETVFCQFCIKDIAQVILDDVEKEAASRA